MNTELRRIKLGGDSGILRYNLIGTDEYIDIFMDTGSNISKYTDIWIRSYSLTGDSRFNNTGDEINVNVSIFSGLANIELYDFEVGMLVTLEIDIQTLESSLVYRDYSLYDGYEEYNVDMIEDFDSSEFDPYDTDDTDNIY